MCAGKIQFCDFSVLLQHDFIIHITWVRPELSLLFCLTTVHSTTFGSVQWIDLCTCIHLLSCVLTHLLGCVLTHLLSCVLTDLLGCVLTHLLSRVLTHLKPSPSVSPLPAVIPALLHL